MPRQVTEGQKDVILKDQFIDTYIWMNTKFGFVPKHTLTYDTEKERFVIEYLQSANPIK